MRISNIDSFINTLDHIDVTIAATHLNYVNSNSVLYTTDAAKKGAISWIKPFNRPQLLHHDTHTDPVGRIVNFDIKDQADSLDEPPDYIELTSRITDEEAINKVLKGLYLTCSVGSSTTRVRCSECDQVLTEDGLCEHEKGSITDSGDKIYWIIDEISYRENSFVNNPADPYSRIVSIDIGQGPIPYKEFLDHRDTLINEQTENFSMKDAITAREKLPSSAFCGPEQYFPANTEDNVKAGLDVLDKIEDLSDSAKAKIKANLYRKGSRFSVSPSNDEIQETPNLLTYRIDEDFTEDEVKIIQDYFTANPDTDLPKVENQTDDNQTDEETETIIVEDFEQIKSKTKKEVIAFAEKAINDFETQLKDSKSGAVLKDEEIIKLNTTISDNESILNNKEDEISKLLDDNAKLDMSYKQAIVSNIIDLKKSLGSTDSDDDLEKKYIGRQLDSLVDTINDLRNEIVNDDNIDRVDDPTLNNNDEETTTQEDTDEDTIVPDTVDPKYSVFFK